MYAKPFDCMLGGRYLVGPPSCDACSPYIVGVVARCIRCSHCGASLVIGRMSGRCTGHDGQHCFREYGGRAWWSSHSAFARCFEPRVYIAKVWSQWDASHSRPVQHTCPTFDAACGFLDALLYCTNDLEERLKLVGFDLECTPRCRDLESQPSINLMHVRFAP